MANDHDIDDLALDDDYSSEGLVKRSALGNIMQFEIFDGTICRKSKEEIEGWEGPIETNNPNTGEKVHTWVDRYDHIVCRIVGVKKYENKVQVKGKDVTLISWTFTLLSGKTKSYMRFRQKKDMNFQTLLKKLPNIDLTKSVSIHAFLDRDKKQVFYIRQGEGKLVEQWPTVKNYWLGKYDASGAYIEGSPQKGADGTIMPAGIPPEDKDDTWNFKAQEKFLLNYFIENIVPAIEANGERLGIKSVKESGASAPEFAGQDALSVVQTEPPFEARATGKSDSMTGLQQGIIKKLCQLTGKTPEKFCQKNYEMGLHEINVEAAAYLIYRLEKLLKKKFPEKLADYQAEKAKLSPKPKASKADDDDDDEEEDDSIGGLFEKNKKAKPSDDDDDDDEDEDEDEDEAPKKKSKKKPVEDDDEDDDDDDDEEDL